MLKDDQFNPAPAIKKTRLNILPENPERELSDRAVKRGRFPSWLHRPIPKGNIIKETGSLLKEQRLHTVCEEARCPNLMECWSNKTATFLAMGSECTRNCGFCSIDFSKQPKPLDPQEPERIAASVVALGLKHVVITMVARDDLSDGGASHLVAIVEAIRQMKPDTTIELLTSDLSGEEKSLDTVLRANPEIFNHNIETVRSLTPRVRHKATYDRTLSLLGYVKSHGTKGLMVKSGIMVGLGETEEEVFETIRDLKESGCDIITIGQYLQADHRKLRVKEFVTPEQFTRYEEYGYSLGLSYMYCGPFVRSSYNAGVVIEKAGVKISCSSS
jgi:lipoic acid synthetase